MAADEVTESTADPSDDLASALDGLGEDLEPPEPDEKAPETKKPEPEKPKEPTAAIEPEPEPEEEPEPELEATPEVVGSLRGQIKGLEKKKIRLESEMKELRQADERRELLLQQISTQFQELRQRIDPQEPEEEHTFSEDPEAGMRKLVKEELAPVLEGEAARRKQEEEAAFRAMSEDVHSYHAQTRETFIEEHPDYLDAAKWLADQEREDRAIELRAAFPDADDDEILANANTYVNLKVAQETMRHAANRTNLHDIAYKRALARGWKAAVKGDETVVTDPKLLNVAKNVRQSKSPRASRQPGAPKVTKAAVARMSDEQYREWASETPLEDLLEIAVGGSTVS